MKNKTLIIMSILTGLLPQICGCQQNVAKTNTRTEVSETADIKNLEAQATHIIQQALASSDARVRANAIEAVASIPANRGRSFLPAVQKLLMDDFVPVRFSSAVAIGDTGYTPAKSNIIQLLRDNDQNVRLAATYAITKLVPNAPDEQIRAGLKSPDLKVRANAAFLLGKTGDKNALPILYDAIKNESSDDKVRINCIEAIARLGDERIYQKVWAMLISAYADDRILGVRAMGALGTPPAKDALMTMLKDDVVEVRVAAAEELGSLGEVTGEKEVQEALTQGVAATPDQQGKESIYMLSSLAIGEIRTPALKKFLPELLKNESPFVKIATAKAVFQCSEQR